MLKVSVHVLRSVALLRRTPLVLFASKGHAAFPPHNDLNHFYYSVRVLD